MRNQYQYICNQYQVMCNKFYTKQKGIVAQVAQKLQPIENKPDIIVAQVVPQIHGRSHISRRSWFMVSDTRTGAWLEEVSTSESPRMGVYRLVREEHLADPESDFGLIRQALFQQQPFQPCQYPQD